MEIEPDKTKWYHEGSEPIDHVCHYCGSNDVTSTATVHWSIKNQQWIVQSIHDDDWCYACKEECAANQIELDPIDIALMPEPKSG